MGDSVVGGKIRTLREALGLSVEQLAERCDCGTGTIDGLEAGEIAPSLAPLIKITRALGVRLGTLLDDDTNVGPIVTRAGEATSTSRVKSLETSSDGGVLDFFSLATGKTARHMEPFIINVTGSNSDSKTLSSHEGEEFLYVLGGAVDVEYGKDSYALGVGDAIYYDSIVPHEVRAAQGTSAVILAVVYAPA